MSSTHAFVRILSFVVGVLAVAGCAELQRRPADALPGPLARTTPAPTTWTEQLAQSGVASYYASALHGRRTANGERFDTRALTAAHNTLPFGTVVRVENVANGRSVDVRVNDRGPFVSGRIIDVSPRAAEHLGMIDAGLASVRVYVVHRADVAPLAIAARS
jgi:rare lipoprotein A